MIKENLESIALLKNLQTEKRNPQESEKLTLSKFNGWGAMWQVFKPEHPQHQELKSILTPDEFSKANASILNAYYTHPDIVKAVWDCVKHLGFEFGHILEPSCGIGYFMDSKIGDSRNDWIGVELDPIPAAIAQYLTRANIYNRGFERTSLPDGYFDLAIGNVPFGAYSVFEPEAHIIEELLAIQDQPSWLSEMLDLMPKAAPGDLVLGDGRRQPQPTDLVLSNIIEFPIQKVMTKLEIAEEVRVEYKFEKAKTTRGRELEHLQGCLF